MSVRIRPCPPLRKVFGKSSGGCGWVDNWIVWPVFCPDSPIGRGLRLRTATVRVRISLGAQIQRTESRKLRSSFQNSCLFKRFLELKAVFAAELKMRWNDISSQWWRCNVFAHTYEWQSPIIAPVKDWRFYIIYDSIPAIHSSKPLSQI